MTLDNQHSQFELDFGFDRELVWHRGGSVRYLLAEIQTPPAPERESRRRRGVNLSLVIDASGSMQGAPLEAAKQAAIGVIERLSEQDCLSVVSFADDVQTHVEARNMDGHGRRKAIAEVAELYTRGCTNLADGWLAGAEHVAAQIERLEGAHNHVVLLSDGHANRGITDERELVRIATNICARGVTTSTVGIGDGYSPRQLQAISEAGGGRMHDAETVDEIIEVVVGELGELGRVVAEQVELELRIPSEVEIEVIGCNVAEIESERVVCSLGSLLSSINRQLAFKVTTPEETIGEQLEFEADFRWQIPGDAAGMNLSTHRADLTFARGRDNSRQSRDRDRSIAVARLWQSEVVRKAVRLNREGDYSEAIELLETELRYFERYCKGLSGTGELVRHCDECSVPSTGHGLSGRARKWNWRCTNIP